MTFNHTIACLNSRQRPWPHGGIGKSGVHFERFTRTSTGSSRESQSGYDTDVSARLHELADGATFVDGRKADEDKFAALVIRGPMLSLELGPNEVERFGNKRELEMMKPALDGGFKTVARLADTDYGGFSGLDYVGLDIFLALHLKAGCRIGRRVGDQMHWTEPDGTSTVETIKPCTCWLNVCLGCNRLRHYVDRDPKSFTAASRTPTGPDDHCPECKAKGDLEQLSDSTRVRL